ncbi:MAG: carboxypeptidase-like regulatory domain-containing protein, partial [Acidimicrobiia bacterium]
MIAAPSGQVLAAQRQVRPLGSLEVRVVDRNRKPIDAIVIVKGGSGWAGRTNAMGYYSVSVPPGSYFVSVSYRGHSSARRVRVD